MGAACSRRARRSHPKPDEVAAAKLANDNAAAAAKEEKFAADRAARPKWNAITECGARVVSTGNNRQGYSVAGISYKCMSGQNQWAAGESSGCQDMPFDGIRRDRRGDESRALLSRRDETPGALSILNDDTNSKAAARRKPLFVAKAFKDVGKALDSAGNAIGKVLKSVASAVGDVALAVLEFVCSASAELKVTLVYEAKTPQMLLAMIPRKPTGVILTAKLSIVIFSGEVTIDMRSPV